MWALKVSICLAAAVVALADDCTTGDKTDFKRPLSVFDPSSKGFSIWMEVSSGAQQRTYVVHEQYDNSSGRYSLEYFDGNNFEKLMYDTETQQLFSYNSEECTTVTKEDSNQVYTTIDFMTWLRFDKIPDEGYIGPAAYFERFVNNLMAGEIADGSIDRIIPSVHYRSCIGSRLDFYYSTEGYSIFGDTRSSPLRVVVDDVVNVEVLAIKSYSMSDDFDLFLPTGVACQNFKEPVDSVKFLEGNYQFQGEVVVSAVESDDVYTSQLSGIIIPSVEQNVDANLLSGIYSFTYSTWYANDNRTKYYAGNTERIIHDVDHNMLYRTTFQKDQFESDLEDDGCGGIFPADNYQAQVQLPFFGSLNLVPLFLKSPKSTDLNTMVNHLGKNKLRFKDVDVFEVSIRDFVTPTGDILSNIVFTYYIDVEYAPQLKAVEVNAYMSNKVFDAVIHVTKVDLGLGELNEKLSVDNCYSDEDKSQYRWFQIGLENSDDQDLVDSSARKIHKAFLKKLYKQFHVAPMRVPQINIDFVDQQVRINTLIIERPLLEIAFKETPMKDFETPTKVLGIMPETECFATCLGMRDRDCTAVSYCGSTCSISDAQNPIAPYYVKDDETCSIYVRSSDHSVPVTAEILRDIKAAATSQDPETKFVLDFKDSEDEEMAKVTLTADSFAVTTDYDSALNYDKNKKPAVDSVYNLANPKTRYTSTSDAKKLGSMSLDDCASACTNREDCETFSYCDNSRECLISSHHDVTESGTQKDNHCVIYQTKYVNRFDRFPGLTFKSPGTSTVAVNADVCAQKCLTDPNCKSFDYCDAQGDCNLLEIHITDAKDFSKADTTKKCVHYSKKYLYDYKTQSGFKGNEGTILGTEVNVTEAACAKYCTEWADPETVCLSFDFCSRGIDNTGICTLRTIDGKGKTIGSPSCDFHSVMAPKPVLVTLHGAGPAFGFSILMLFVGVGIGVGALVGYSKYRGV